MMTLIIILFIIQPAGIYSQCIDHRVADQSVIAGGMEGVDNYYLNLIIQDIALAGQQNFSEISLRFDYQVRYMVNSCSPGRTEISVLPVLVRCNPLHYHGYDISDAVKPEKVDLVFHLVQANGYISDSLVFYSDALNKDSSLYTSLSAVRTDTSVSLSVSFSKAVFHYTQASYDLFRDRILQIDQYYAASLVADSTLAWTENGFLSETPVRTEMILRQAELERILRYINPTRFHSVILTGNDIGGLNSRYRDLSRTNNRFTAIIDFDRLRKDGSGKMISTKGLINNYLDRFDHYHQLAYHSDFRFVNFIEGMAKPDFSNAGMIAIYQGLCQYRYISVRTFREACRLLAQGLIERGATFDTTGNQLRALTYYSSAYKLARLMNLRKEQSSASHLSAMMKDGISSSYMEISKKAALSENPLMASQYFHEALALFTGNGHQYPVPTWLQEYGIWLYKNFESQSVKYIELKNYNKALTYLDEIQLHCMTAASYPCPEKFHEWMGMAREGIYLDLLDKAWNLYPEDKSGSADLYRQAVALRSMAGYRIGKVVLEEKLEVSFRQLQYDDLFKAGMDDYNSQEFVSSLYYFNKASDLENSGLLQPKTGLNDYRQNAARQVILLRLSDGRVKSWAHDNEAAESALKQVEGMLSDYGFAQNDSLYAKYYYLAESIRRNKCEKIVRAYHDLMAQADSARAGGDPALAGTKTEEAVSLSIAHLECAISDNDAWYQKVMLEAPSDYQVMEKNLDQLAHESYTEYLLAFQELRDFYYSQNLLAQGIAFVPLFDRVIQHEDSVFLEGMLNHYTMLKDLDHAFTLLKRLHDLGIFPAHLAYEQEKLAESMAQRDALDPNIKKPWDRLDSYTGHDDWYRSFRKSYKPAWFKAAGWKVRYWPLMWKK